MVRWLSTVLLLQVLLYSPSYALETVPLEKASPLYVAQIQLHTADELSEVLLRAERLQASGEFLPGKQMPIVFVLHGPEARVFFQNNYLQYKRLVDMAARLSAFEVVDIRVCETWMGGDGLDRDSLPPFVGTVHFGPEEQRRLLKDEDYIYF